MPYQSLRYQGSVEDLLVNLPYEWRATGEFALSLIGLNNRAKPTDYWIYVSQENFDKAIGYLTSSGASPTRVLPNLRVQSIKKLPPSAEKNHYVARGYFLARDAHRTLSPRLLEAQPKILESLRKVA